MTMSTMRWAVVATVIAFVGVFVACGHDDPNVTPTQPSLSKSVDTGLPAPSPDRTPFQMSDVRKKTP